MWTKLSVLIQFPSVCTCCSLFWAIPSLFKCVRPSPSALSLALRTPLSTFTLLFSSRPSKSSFARREKADDKASFLSVVTRTVVYGALHLGVLRTWQPFGLIVTPETWWNGVVQTPEEKQEIPGDVEGRPSIEDLGGPGSGRDFRWEVLHGQRWGGWRKGSAWQEEMQAEPSADGLLLGYSMPFWPHPPAHSISEHGVFRAGFQEETTSVT